VAFGGEQDFGYSDAVEFFRRTYLTEGLTDLVARAVRRFSGDDNAPPVINLQTNFGGGKTHSMLALWHVAAGLAVGQYPQDTQDLLTANGYNGGKVNRVAIVGNHFSPSVKPRTTVRTLIPFGVSWPGSSVAPRPMHLSPRPTRIAPRRAKRFTNCLAKHSPAVILLTNGWPMPAPSWAVMTWLAALR